MLRYAIACALLISSLSVPARAADEKEFPYAVAFETGRTQFRAGDSIIIQSVRGTAATFQTNEMYCVEGTYTLASRDEAELCLFLTSKSEVQTKMDPRQVQRVKRGSGTFRLIIALPIEGNPHVSFYPVPGGGDFGGVYFGKGNWLWAESTTGPSASRDGNAVSVEGANAILLDYLGNPVATPPNLDPAYSAAGLREAMTAAAKAAGVSVRRVEVDESEFPFMIYATGNDADFARLKTQFGKMKNYAYYGSVGGIEGHTFTLVPSTVWPAEAHERIFRRASLRMQVFYSSMSGK